MQRSLMRRVLLRVGLLMAMASTVRAEGPVGVASADGPDRNGKQPQVAVDARGRIFVAFGREDLIRCAVSDDGGKTFTTHTVGSPGTLALGMRRGPRVASAGDSLVVTAIGGKIGKGKDGDVLAWRSTDAGQTWSGPTRVNQVEGSAREGLHGIAASPDGRTLFCTWLDLRSSRMEVFGARSGDGGTTWEPDALVYRSPEGPICPCCHPSAAFGPDGSLVVMWRNSLGGNRDLYFTCSTDLGRSFGPAEKLGQRSWTLNACPMDGGAIAIGPDGRITSAWMRAGSVFTATPGEPERPLGTGVQAWTAFGPSGPVSVWLDRRPGKLLALLPGATAPTLLADRGNDPVIAATPDGRGPVVVAWESPGGPSAITCQVLTPAEAQSR